MAENTINTIKNFRYLKSSDFINKIWCKNTKTAFLQWLKTWVLNKLLDVRYFYDVNQNSTNASFFFKFLFKKNIILKINEF